MKILFSNLEYCTGINGSLFQYIVYGIKYLFCPKFVQMRILKKVSEMIKRENPDICCFLEIGSGASNRAFVDQMKELFVMVNKKVSYPFFDIEIKYPLNNVLRYLPFFKGNCSGVLARKKFKLKKIFLKKSSKGLVYEIFLNEKISLLFMHFSLWNWSRKLQYESLSKIISDVKREGKEVILCGDFNLFWGHEDFQKFVKSCDLTVVNKFSDKTFPACEPNKFIDLFLISDGVNIKKLRVLSDQFSDHLPIMLEIM